VNRRLQHLGMAQTDLLRKCLLLLRPLQIMFGVIFILLVFLIMISLMITKYVYIIGVCVCVCVYDDDDDDWCFMATFGHMVG